MVGRRWPTRRPTRGTHSRTTGVRISGETFTVGSDQHSPGEAPTWACPSRGPRCSPRRGTGRPPGPEQRRTYVSGADWRHPFGPDSDGADRTFEPGGVTDGRVDVPFVQKADERADDPEADEGVDEDQRQQEHEDTTQYLVLLWLEQFDELGRRGGLETDAGTGWHATWRGPSVTSRTFGSRRLHAGTYADERSRRPSSPSDSGHTDLSAACRVRVCDRATPRRK